MRILVDVGTESLGLDQASVQIVQFRLKAENIQNVELAERPEYLCLGRFGHEVRKARIPYGWRIWFYNIRRCICTGGTAGVYRRHDFGEARRALSIRAMLGILPDVVQCDKAVQAS